MEIQKTDFSKFLQNQDFALHTLILAEVKKLTDEHLPAVVEPYEEALNQFDEALKNGGTSPIPNALLNWTSSATMYIPVQGHTSAPCEDTSIR